MAQINKVNRNKQLIIAGDINRKVGRRKNDQVVGNFGENTVNTIGETDLYITMPAKNLRIFSNIKTSGRS